MNLRPHYHFMPPANWTNDPIPFFWKGEYHIFYQHNPNGAFWGTMHWGHGVSRDLVHWTHLPIALAPSPDGPDKDGCFTGCAVNYRGAPTILYTGVFPEVQCLASSPDTITWTKHGGNPVISAPPPGLKLAGFRDPCVWQAGDAWRMIIGTGIEGIGGAALLYRSDDLAQWEYLHPLYVGNKDETGEMFECPDFFPLGDKYVLLASPIPLRRTVYFVGTYDDQRFTPQAQGITDFGNFYAAKTLVDARGRRLLWGWIQEEQDVETQKANGWAGLQSVPRVLSLREDSTLGIEPAPELRALRRGHTHFENLELTSSSPGLLPGVQGDCLEIVAEILPGDAQEVGFSLRCAPDGSEQAPVVYRQRDGQLSIDRPHSNLGAVSGPLKLAAGEAVKMHILLDRSVVEVFANGRLALTGRIYPARNDSLGVGLWTRGVGATVQTLDVWEIQ